jgi:hypothetical protein
MYRDGTSLTYDPSPATAVVAPPEESLVSDARAGLTPAQQVEQKLVSLLQNTPLPVSRLQNAGPRRSLS